MTSSSVAAARTKSWGGLPTLDLPAVPETLALVYRLLFVAAIVLGLYLIDRLTYAFLDYWLLEELGYEAVFWTNLKAASLLFLWGFVGPLLAIGLPALRSDIDSAWRRVIVTIAVLAGMTGGYLLMGEYPEFLALFGSVPAGETDPVFGRDISFYMFTLPGIWKIWWAVMIPLLLGIVSSLLCTRLARARREVFDERKFRLSTAFVESASPLVYISVALIGVLAAIGVWLARYNLLWKDNYTSSIYVGADYIDVNGLFSYLNYYHFTALLVLAFTAVVLFWLLRARDQHLGTGLTRGVSIPVAYAAVAIIALDFAFAGIVGLRNSTQVSPNEPVIQLPYLKNHVEGTLKGYGLDKVETVNFTPLGADDPIPDAAELLQTATLKNASLWPGHVSYLERVLDPQHADRVLLTGGDATIYGPTLDIFRAQQKLRTYYDFLSIDTVRYTIDGEKQMFASSPREVPLADPQPWVSWWGQRMLLFTHGHGLVMIPTGEVRAEGEPIYAASGVPMTAVAPELLPAIPHVYYGDGGGATDGRDDYDVMGFSNARNIKEFDRPGDEERLEIVYPPDVRTGVPVDSLLKRLVIGWRSGVAFDIWFSDLIAGETRAHYYRRPLHRMDRIAPFLYHDTNTMAVVHEDRIVWMVNSISYSDRYPYSRFWQLGDKSSEQTTQQRPEHWVNYVRDSVKTVVDAYTGDVKLFKIADEPIVNTWANVYPTLFTNGDDMPAGIRAHLYYPSQLFHLQFDDAYNEYHQRDPLTYYNVEDLWDDADEVKGAIIDEGEAITFSIEPRFWMAETGDVLPASSEQVQFSQSMVFTNENALNLRAITVVYQDGADYGRLMVLQIPKGHFYPSPEQADAAIDQDPYISERISWWNRMGSEVTRGHTSTLVIGREILYVEPLFIRSKQNPISEMKRVIVVFRGYAADGATLAEALESAIAKARAEQQTRQLVSAGQPEGGQSEPVKLE